MCFCSAEAKQNNLNSHAIKVSAACAMDARPVRFSLALLTCSFNVFSLQKNVFFFLLPLKKACITILLHFHCRIFYNPQISSQGCLPYKAIFITSQSILIPLDLLSKWINKCVWTNLTSGLFDCVLKFSDEKNALYYVIGEDIPLSVDLLCAMRISLIWAIYHNPLQW